MSIAFDDIDAINDHAGDDFGDWGTEIHVTQTMIDAFAELTGDRQWIHVDVERCERESPFGGPIAHGYLTMSLLPMLITVPVELSGVKNAVNYGCEGARLLSPVPAGSTIHARSWLLGAEAHRAGTLVSFESATHVVGNERPSLVYTSQILYQG